MCQSIDCTAFADVVAFLQKEKGKGHPPKNWKVLKERRQQIKQKLKKQADDWMRN